MKSKTTATLLAFFLGGFGVHRFYLGQTGLGLLYLLFCWTLVPAVIAFIDFFMLLFMSDEAFNQKYNLTALIMQSKDAGSSNNNTIAINMGAPQMATAAASGSDEIVKLYELKEKGIITAEEFELKKRTLL